MKLKAAVEGARYRMRFTLGDSALQYYRSLSCGLRVIGFCYDLVSEDRTSKYKPHILVDLIH
jgi:hypothetical protein